MILKKAESILIIGCGRLGACLAGSLSQQGYQVCIIDKDEDSFRKLPESFSGYELNGDATDIDVLVRAGISDVNMVAVTTENDNVNCLIAQVASRIYSVNKVYTRLNDTNKEKLLDGFNIEVIYPFKLAVEEFERLSSLSIGEVE